MTRMSATRWWLGQLWMLPLTLLSAVYLGIFWALGWVRYAGTSPYALVLAVREGNWLWRYMTGRWCGWASGGFIIVRVDLLRSSRILAHEQCHVLQQMFFGIAHPFLYVLSMLVIVVFLRTKSPYYDNPFEVEAREYAEKFAPDKLKGQELRFKVK